MVLLVAAGVNEIVVVGQVTSEMVVVMLTDE